MGDDIKLPQEITADDDDAIQFADDDDMAASTALTKKKTEATIVPIATFPQSYMFRSRFRTVCSRKVRKRAIFKNGDCNVGQSHMSKRKRRYLRDLFTTLVDVRWRWTLLVFALSFILTWLFFSLLWWLIAFTHGDLEPGHSGDDSNWVPCVIGVNGFTTAFLFSIETQHTIGYGSRSTTEECPEAVFLMCLQSVTGVFIQAFTVGIVFAKMARPKQRSQTLVFSRSAVISLRDGYLCFMFRVGDMREKSHLISSSVRGYLVKQRMTKEGESLSPYMYEIQLQADDYETDLFLIWPATVYHRITEASPLYDMSAADLMRDRFEIIIVLEGTAESTGQTTQARTSYLPSEILWGHRFQPMVHFDKLQLLYSVNFSLFHNTTQVETPLCSARDLAGFMALARAQQEASNIPHHSPETLNL